MKVFDFRSFTQNPDFQSAPYDITNYSITLHPDINRCYVKHLLQLINLVTIYSNHFFLCLLFTLYFDAFETHF
jgi:hypothetical protein